MKTPTNISPRQFTANLCTNADGEKRHLQHIDFQCLFSYKNTLTFTGKEKDSETGFYHFGARYYDPTLSGLFLSVDPMADKYPSTSPYAYCVWNPVKIIDPNGMDTIVSINIENGEINMSVSEKYARGCLVQYLNNGTEEPIKEYICTGYIYSYKRGRTSIIDFEENADAENVYNQLSGRIDGNLTSSVEWNYYDNMFDIPSQIITSQKRDEIDVSDFMELGGLTNSVRHYQPYYSDLEYSLPSPEDIIYSRKIKTPCYLDYCGKSYRFDELVPRKINNITIGIIRRMVKSKVADYEGFCQ